MTTKKQTAPSLLQIPSYADLVAELGEPNLAKAKSYEECVDLAWREKKAG